MHRYNLGEVVDEDQNGVIVRGISATAAMSTVRSPGSRQPAITPLSADVAVKRFKTNCHSWDQLTDVNEVHVMKRLGHPTVVKLREVVREGLTAYLIQDHLPANLAQAVAAKAYNNGRVETYSLPQLKLIAFQLLTGLAYLHDQGVVHRNIRPENILVGSKYCTDELLGRCAAASPTLGSPTVGSPKKNNDGAQNDGNAPNNKTPQPLNKSDLSQSPDRTPSTAATSATNPVAVKIGGLGAAALTDPIGADEPPPAAEPPFMASAATMPRSGSTDAFSMQSSASRQENITSNSVAMMPSASLSLNTSGAQLQRGELASVDAIINDDWLLWGAPELVIRNDPLEHATFASDMWAAGAVLAYAALRKPVTENSLGGYTTQLERSLKLLYRRRRLAAEEGSNLASPLSPETQQSPKDRFGSNLASQSSGAFGSAVDLKTSMANTPSPWMLQKRYDELLGPIEVQWLQGYEELTAEGHPVYTSTDGGGAKTRRSTTKSAPGATPSVRPSIAIGDSNSEVDGSSVAGSGVGNVWSQRSSLISSPRDGAFGSTEDISGDGGSLLPSVDNHDILPPPGSKSGKLPRLLNKAGVDPKLSSLIQQLLRWDPSERLTAKDALRHAFFQDTFNRSTADGQHE